MTFKVEFTPEADADLDRLFDFLLDRAQTAEEAMRAHEAVEAIRIAANSHLSTSPTATERWGSDRRCVSSLSPSARPVTCSASISERWNWSSSLAHAINAKKTSTEGLQRSRHSAPGSRLQSRCPSGHRLRCSTTA